MNEKKKTKRQKVVHFKQPLGQTKQMETGNKEKKRRRRRAVVVVKIFSRAEEKQQMGEGRVSGNWYELVVMVGVWNKRKKNNIYFDVSCLLYPN